MLLLQIGICKSGCYNGAGNSSHWWQTGCSQTMAPGIRVAALPALAAAVAHTVSTAAHVSAAAVSHSAALQRDLTARAFLGGSSCGHCRGNLQAQSKCRVVTACQLVSRQLVGLGFQRSACQLPHPVTGSTLGRSMRLSPSLEAYHSAFRAQDGAELDRCFHRLQMWSHRTLT